MKVKDSTTSTLVLGLSVILVVLLVANQIFIMNIGTAMKGVSLSLNSARSAQATTQVATDYGIALDSSGYDKLVGFDKSISLSSNQSAQIYEAIIGRDKNNKPYIAHPCCAGAIGECNCGHAVALRGLTKYLLEKGYEPNQIIQETKKWNALFFPQQGSSGGLGGCG